MFDADKNRMIGLPYGEKNHDDMLSRFRMVRFHMVRTERNGRTDRRTDRFAILISRISMLTRDKNCLATQNFIKIGNWLQSHSQTIFNIAAICHLVFLKIHICS